MAVRWPTGVVIGGAVSFVLLITGCVLMSAAGVVIGMTGLAMALAAFICSAVGSKINITLSVAEAGQTNCNVTRHIAFLPIHSEGFCFTSNDTLHKRVCDRPSVSFSPAVGDIILLVLTVPLCVSGVIPAIVAWVVWWNVRDREPHTYTDVTLTLIAYDRGRPVQLWNEKVKDYRGTRFGDPAELDKLIKMFARFNGPRLVVEEM
jgi:hypothetical protein